MQKIANNAEAIERDGSTQTASGERVQRVFPRLPAFVAGDDSSQQLSTAEVLAAFAEEGLLELDFLEPNATAVLSPDLRRVTSIVSSLAERSGTISQIYMVNAILAPAVIEGTPEQKQRLLQRLRSGALELAFALTEPEAGSDAAAVATTATATSDGFVLRGEKLYTTGAMSADFIIVVARIADQGTDKRAFGLFLVPKNAPGLTVEALRKLSANQHASCHLTLRDVHAGPDQVLGGKERIGAAWNTLRMTGTFERLVVAGRAHGLGRAIVRRALEFATSRRQFGQSIAKFQAIQHGLVEMQTLATTMGLLVENALAAADKGGDAMQEICMAKYYCAEQLQRIVALGCESWEAAATSSSRKCRASIARLPTVCMRAVPSKFRRY